MFSFDAAILSGKSGGTFPGANQLFAEPTALGNLLFVLVKAKHRTTSGLKARN
jgi:hypothetical protein